MATASVNLDTTQYVRINNAYNPLVLQAHRDAVRIVFNPTQPSRNNTAFHLLRSSDAPLRVESVDTNVWALAMSSESSLTITENSGIMSDDFQIAVAKGLVPGHRIEHKFGHASVDTTLVPITTSTTFQTPTTPIQLEIISSDVNDSPLGVGGHKVLILGIDSNYDVVEFIVTLNGTTPVQLPQTILRLNRMYIVESGSYADAVTASHIGTITLRETATPANVWGIIGNTPIPHGQTEIGCFTIPKGFTGYLMNKKIYVDSGKTASVFFFQRQNPDDITPPYTGTLRLIEREVGLTGVNQADFKYPRGPFTGPCDIGFMGRVATTAADISVEFELLLVQDGF